MACDFGEAGKDAQHRENLARPEEAVRAGIRYRQDRIPAGVPLLRPIRSGPSDYDPQAAPPLIVIPARDEAATIGSVIEATRAQGFHDIVVIDDGSSDATAADATTAGATVLRAPLPRSLGRDSDGDTVRRSKRLPGVITMDADGQHEPAYLEQLLEASRAADVVIGATQAGKPIAPFRLVLFQISDRLQLEDLTSGFRYYNLPACCQLAVEEATLLDYQDIGVLLILHKAGFRIREIAL